MLNRRDFLAVLASASLPRVLAPREFRQTQHAAARRWSAVQDFLNAPVRRVGYVNGNIPELHAAFKDALRALGYIQGENLFLLEMIAADPKQLAEIAASDLELVVAGALPYALAIRQAIPAMPMVLSTCPGMVSNGFAKSLEHPGGNTTGIDELPPGVTAKRLTLLKTVVPSVTRVGLLSTTPGTGGHEAQVADAEQVAASLKISIKVYRALTTTEVEKQLNAMVTDGMDAFANFQGRLSVFLRQRIVDFAAQHRIPAVYPATMFAEIGGLMSWAPDIVEQQRRSHSERREAWRSAGSLRSWIRVDHQSRGC
jgi:putative ABC transport system substrate-binding protein